ncbi:MAG: hypothetical protein NT103_03625 [Campylobacterales bacterium]|nr:hypothetical protein [Campylobacterales bacterium]
MKALISLVSASAILVTLAFAETPVKSEEQVQNKVQNESQNRFKNMKTDELLEKRGTMTSQQEREQLQNELMTRQQTMTKEQKEKFNKRPPENRIPKGMDQGGGMDNIGGGKGGR